MTAHPPIAAAITDARNKPRNMSPPAWVRTASMPRAPPRFESPLASLLSPSGLYCDAVPPDIPLDLAAALAERYELREVLGRGGMATVYLAYDRKHRRDVALKVLLPGLAAFLGVERFLKEIQVAARLTHPHILALHDSGEAGGFLYYVMPYLEGGSVRQQLAGRRPRGADQALAIAPPVADALSYAHRMGVLHRDIKPENILFSQGHPIVSDFGIAKAISTAGGANLTRTGFPVGTPGYMSPEQAAGLTDLDERTDVYSLAVVIYEMLVGEVPGRWPTEDAGRGGGAERATPLEPLARRSDDAAVRAGGGRRGARQRMVGDGRRDPPCPEQRRAGEPVRPLVLVGRHPAGRVTTRPRGSGVGARRSHPHRDSREPRVADRRDLRRHRWRDGWWRDRADHRDLRGRAACYGARVRGGRAAVAAHVVRDRADLLPLQHEAADARPGAAGRPAGGARPRAGSGPARAAPDHS